MPTPLNNTQLSAVLDALRANGKIEAIKLYREFTGAGLAEAKEAVEHLADHGTLPTPAGNQASVVPAILPERQAWIEEALFKGQKIEAIKMYRDGTNLGLKESKEAVEKLEADLRLSMPGRFSAPPARNNCLMIMLGMIFTVGVITVELLRLVFSDR